MAHGDPIFGQVGQKSFIHKDIFACLFSILNIISLSCHEQVCLSGLRFERFTGFQLKFLIIIEFPNILHWKKAKKIKSSVVLGQNLGQIISNSVKAI